MFKKISYLLTIAVLLCIIPGVNAACSDCSYENCSNCGNCYANPETNKCEIPSYYSPGSVKQDEQNNKEEEKNYMSTETKYSNFNPESYSCGNSYIENIPVMVPKTIKIVYIIIQIIVPIVLVIFGMIDLMKGIAASKEDEIKKGQKTFISRLIAAAIMFFVFSLVKLVISLVADDGNKAKIIDCMDCFINEKCDVGGEDEEK